MSGIDAKSAFDSAWSAALDRRGAGTNAGGDALREAFDRASARFEDGFANAASGGAPATDAASALEAAPDSTAEALRAVDTELKGADTITEDLLAGRIDSPHEVAARLRRADLTLRYSLEIRNRLVDAYREIMRMSV